MLCWCCIKDMEQLGVIQCYMVLFDCEKFGLYVCVFVYVYLMCYNEGGVEQFECEIVICLEVIECYSMIGEVDYIFKIVVLDIKVYDVFLYECIFKILVVLQVCMSVVLCEIKFDM